MESIRKIRQAYHRDKKPIRQIAREFHVSKNTVKKIIRTDITEQIYQPTEQPRPRLSQYEDRLKELLAEDNPKPVRHRRSAQFLFEQLQREGFSGGHIRRPDRLCITKSAKVQLPWFPVARSPGRWLECVI